MQPGDVLVVTSKIVSIDENRIVARESITKYDLIRREADRYLGPGLCGVEITIKEGLLLPSSGIDESNSESDAYLLYPSSPQQSAERLHKHLAKVMGFANFGVILSDSRSLPLRRGVTGVALSYWGFEGVQSRVGEPDLFGRNLKATHINVVDTLASMAVLSMGEGAESQPLAVVRGIPGLKFIDGNDMNFLRLNPDQDLFQPLWS